MKHKVKNIIKNLQKITKQTKYYQNRLASVAENTEVEFNNFLDLLIYYMCVGCGADIDKTYPRKKHWCNSHHNGLFNQSLFKIDEISIFNGLMKAYDVYLVNKKNPVDLEIDLANAFCKYSKPLCTNHQKLHAVLEYFFTNRNVNFIRHGLEDFSEKNYIQDSSFPPNFSMQNYSLSLNGKSFAIEIDRPPFLNCFEHGKVWPWYYCGGVMTLDDFKKHNGILKIADDREHFYAESNILISDWYFIYNTKAKYTKRLKFDVNLMKKSILQMKKSGANFIEMQTLRKFFHVINLLEHKIEVSKIIKS